DDSDWVYAISSVNGKFAAYMSGDGGMSFITQVDFPTDISNESGGMLAVTADNPNVMLAVMLSSDYTPLLYKGVLVGAAWIWNLLATGQTGTFPMNNGQGYFDLVLEISPNDENIIFTGTTTLYKSTNAGQQFTAVGGYSGDFSIHPDIQDMKLLTNGETWVSTDGGFSLTTDNFTNTANCFFLNNGLIGSDMWGFDQGWNEDIVVGGRYHNGNTSIADFYQPKALRMGGAESPTGWVLQGKSRHVAFNDLGNGWILPQTAEGQPEGRFIFSKYPNMDEYGGRRGNIVFHPNYYSNLYLGEGNAFWESTDGGVCYDMLYDFGNKVRYLQISYSNPDVFYADVVNEGLYKSTDGGLNWTLKPALTNGQYGTSYWEGRTFFAISPYDENVIYACLQNGTWSSDIGKVFRSDDGGETWEDWTGSLSEYTKNLIIQPDNNGEDLVYLFTNAKNGQIAKVYYRKQEMNDWELFSNNYPAGKKVNLALPFFRDDKLRVAGNAGVWESPLQETEYSPIINPWLEKSFVNCMTDTLSFEDHSFINHDGVSWNWEIIPEPVFISDASIRNPKVVLGAEGVYSVNYSVTKNDSTYSKYLPDAITATTCPSIEDCDNPAEIPKDIWELVYVDSEEINYPGLAIMAFDDDPTTIWHTRWSTGSDPYPHEIQVDFGQDYRLFEFILLNRQNGPNGRIKEYELYVSEDTLDWGEPVSTGEFENTAAPQKVIFSNSVIGRYFRLVGLSEVNGNAWSSAAELSFVGCTDITYEISQKEEAQNILAFPVPTNGMINISLPAGNHFNYKIISLVGRIVEKGSFSHCRNTKSFNLNQFENGIYIIQLTNKAGITYRV
ncbi:MAG: discoidin domain-containing protein, partial [Bacteroidales bacterium]|nr:discoidin domain-containing protein [Bacteroidales bacterium]